MKDLLKTAAGVGVSLLAGALVSEIEPFRSGHFLWWSASSLVKFAAFSGSAMLVGIQGQRISRGFLVADNVGLTGIVKALLVGGVSALTYGALGQVAAPEFAGVLQGGFATWMVGVSGYTIWKGYEGFDDVVALTRGAVARSVMSSGEYTPLPRQVFTGEPTLAPRSPDGPSARCSECGNHVPSEYNFCGVCGTRVTPADRMVTS